MLSERALQPPRTLWDGPQPGLTEQSDAAHRYFFSKKHGRIESIVCYSAEGKPQCRVSYKNARPQEMHTWNGAGFEFSGAVNECGELIAHAPVPNQMIDALGARRPMPAGEDFFITPAGFVVRMLLLPNFFRKMKSEYEGRLALFSPEQPFHFVAPGGARVIPPHTPDLLMHADGTVFRVTRAGLRAIGELLPYIVAGEHSRLLTKFANDDIALAMQGGEVHAQTLFSARALPETPPTISGAHPFVRADVPVMEHPAGENHGEQALRAFEHAAFQLALVIRALRSARAQEPQNHALLVAAHNALEQRMWDAAAQLEKIVGAAPHQIVDRALVRAWLDAAVKNPARALERISKSYAD